MSALTQDHLPAGYSLDQDQDGDWLLYGPPDEILFSEPGEPLFIGTCDEPTALADALEHIAAIAKPGTNQ